MEPDMVGRRVPGRGMRYAAVTALAALAAGILVQRVAAPPWWLMVLPVPVGVALVRASRGWSLLAALAGAAGLLALAREPPPVPETLYRQERFRGCVLEEPLGNSRRAVVRLEAPLRGRCLVWLDPGADLRVGEPVEVRAPIERFNYPRNPGVFDRNEYYRRRGFVGQARASRFTLRRLARQPGWRMPAVWLAAARRWMRRVYQEVLEGERAAVMAALLLGERGGLEQSTSRLFTDAGVLHVLAVSGLHVGIVAGLFWLLLGMLQLRGWWRFGLAGAGILLYVLLVGARPSALRAGLMFGVLLLSAPLQRRYDPVAGLGAAGIVLLAMHPATLFDTGFQLSFAAAGAIALVMNRVRDWPGWREWHTQAGRVLRRWFVFPALVALAASVATAPLLLHHFGRVQPLGVPVSPLVVLVVGLALPLGFVVLLAWLLSPALAAVFGASLGLLLDALLGLVGWFGSQRWSLVESFSLSWLAVGCCYAGLAAAWNWNRPRARNRLPALLLVGLNLAVWPVALRGERAGAVFLDPGSGDALIIEDGLGRMALVDAGINGAGVLRDYLRARGIRRLELAIVTHPDLDHYGGLLDLSSDLRIGTMLVSTLRGDTAYRGIIERFRDRGTRVLVGGAGTSARLGGWTFDFAWPSPVARARFHRGLVSTNNLSLIVLARHGGHSLLLTGDLDEPAILGRTPTSAWLLKSPHHGSREGNTDLLFELVRPEKVVVMGRHPTPAGLEQRLTGGTVDYVNTRRDGAWQLEFRGGSVREVRYRPTRP